MSLFAGMYSIKQQAPLKKTAINQLKQALTIPMVKKEVFQTPYFFLIKFDVGLFEEPGFRNHEQDGVAALTGMPIVVLNQAESFSRSTDMRLLMEQFAHGNIQILRQCCGTFSFCYYQPSTHTLLLATDKVGARPVYYYTDNQFIYFASSIKLLESLETIPKRMNLTAFIEQYFFCYPLGNKTLYYDIRVLRDGQYIKSAPATPLQCLHYFRWDSLPVRHASQKEFLEESYAAFFTAVNSRSRNSPQVFSFLSGGLDSRCIVSALTSFGKQVIALNSSSPGTKDQLFSQQFARQLDIRFIAAQYTSRPSTSAGSRTAQMFEDMLQSMRPQLGNQDVPKRIFSGDGGGEMLGFLQMNETLFSLFRQGKIDKAIRSFTSAHRQLPERILNHKFLPFLKQIPLQGMKQELEDMPGVEAERALFLFLLRNDLRRHLHDYYERIEQFQVELLLPFYDARLLEVLASAPLPLDSFLYHKFYHQWLQYFPEEVRAVPWQTYPGHLPCPLTSSETCSSQWQIAQQVQASASSFFITHCLKIVQSRRFPSMLIRRPMLLLAIVLHRLKLCDGTYIFQFCMNLHEHYVKCTSIHLEGDNIFGN